MMKPAGLGARTFLLLAFATAAAQAQSSAPGAAGASATETASGALRVRFELGASELDPAVLRAEIERELKRPVMVVSDGSAALSLSVRDSNRLVLEYDDARSGKLERSVDLPREPRRAAEVIALLVGNVARDETGEILRSLEPVPSAAPEEPPPAEPQPVSAPTPAPTPAPAAAKTKARRGRFNSRRRWLGLRSPFDDLTRGPLAFNLSLAHPIALLRDSDRRVLHLELGLAYSKVGALEGAGMNLGALVVQRNVRGVALGVFWNEIGGDTRGLSGTLIYERSGGSLEGVSLGGLVARRKGQVQGLQAALVFNEATDVRGALLGGAINNARRVEGAAAATAVNILSGDAEGAVLAAGVNVTSNVDGVVASTAFNRSRDVRGVTLSAGLNVARNVHGVSAGLINFQDRVEGVQLGFVNIAREVDGASLGVVNVAGNGRVQPIVYGSTAMPIHLGVKFLVGYTYSELGWAAAPSDDVQSPEGGLGMHFPLGASVYVEPGVHYSEVLSTKNDDQAEHGDIHYRARLGVRLFDAFDLFGGGGVIQRIHGADSGKISGEALFGVAAL
jgi:hypothetical protein